MTNLVQKTFVGLFLVLLVAVAYGEESTPKSLKKSKNSKESEDVEEYPDWSFGGTFFIDGSGASGTGSARDNVDDDGLVGEFSVHATGYLDETITVEVRACIGCHGFELNEAYGEFRLSDEVVLKGGRMNVPFGAFTDERYDPAVNEFNSKPLPYAMGFMARGDEFNQGVLPAPFVDNGITLGGTLWFADETVELDYEIFGIAGFNGTTTDFNFVTSRDFEDNNSEPAGGARLVTTIADGDLTLGASGMMGRYDPGHKLDYWVIGGDGQLELGPFIFRGEYVYRITEYQIPGPPFRADEFLKHGYYAQVIIKFNDRFKLVFMHDSLAIEDIFLSPSGPTPTFGPGITDNANVVYRYVAGFNFEPHSGVLIKMTAEFWDFSDFDDVGVYHAGLVFEF